MASNENHGGTDLIIALDFPREDQAWEVVQALDGLDVVFKVGLELFSAAGPQFVRELVHRKKRVFLDLKLHDIPNTVASAMARLMGLAPVPAIVNVHATGGLAMMRAAAAAMRTRIP